MMHGRFFKPFAAFLLLWVIGLGSARAATYWELTEQASWNSSITVDYQAPVGSIYVGDNWSDVSPIFCPENSVNGEVLSPHTSTERCTWQGVAIRYRFSQHVCTDPDVWDGNACTPPPACGDNEVEDPVNGICVCQDGYVRDETNSCVSDDSPGPEPSTCNSDATCLSYVEQVCNSYGQQVMNYQYFGGGQYGYECGLMTNSCPTGQVWNAPTQVCINDGDSDGTPDPFDPDPTNPDVDGDSDSDGVPDEQDSHPNDPTQWNGSTLSGQPITIGQPQDPIGPSTDFDDTAIVSAINETIEQGNTSNSLLEDIQGTAAASNDLLNDGFTSLGDGLSETNGLLSGINETLQPVDGQQTIDTITGLMEQTSEELGIQELQESDTSFVSTGANVFKTAQCNNPVFDGHTIDLCSHASRIVPIAEFIIWLGTLLFIWNEVHRTLRRQS